MENASKALIMAASVLIGIMILSLAVYLFATFGSTSAELHKQQDTDRLNQFNTQFTSYEDKNGLTIYDVITVANLATENNKYYELPTVNTIPTTDTSDYYVSVFKGNNNISYGIGITEDEITDHNNNLISADINEIESSQSKKLPTYKCKAFISSKTGRVYKVIFTKE